MIFDSIKPTFSIPRAAEYFDISSDGGKTFKHGNEAIVNYYALNKMDNFSGEFNTLNLIFEKRNDLEDSRDYRITKILVNEASIFDSNNYGENVSGHGQQNKGDYLAGNYVTYNNVTSGGVNFKDFKIASIDNTDMQIVFFVNPLNGVEVNFISSSVTYGGISLVPSFVSGGGKRIVNINDTITLVTNCYMSFPSDWVRTNYSFKYGITKNAILTFTQEPPNPTQTGEQYWTTSINNIIWEADPEIVLGPVSFTFEGYKVLGEEIYLPTARYIYNYTLTDPINDIYEWIPSGDSIGPGWITIYDYAQDGIRRLDSNESNRGISANQNDQYRIKKEDINISWP